MNWFDRISFSIFGGMLLTLGFLIFLDYQKRSMNVARIILKINNVQDLIDDLKGLSKNIQTKCILNNVHDTKSEDLSAMEKNFNMIMLSEIIDSKAEMMHEAARAAIKEAKSSYRLVP